MKRYLTILIIAAFSMLAKADGFTLNSRHVTTADGLAGNIINALVQDDEGFVWMATNNGLSRYDGFTAVNYTSLASDGDHRLEARVGRIFSDRQRGLLWLNTATFQNACYDLRQGRFIDWTGTGDQYRRQSKLMLTTRGMVLYGNNSGATLCGMTGGRPWVSYYNRQQGNMKSDDVLTVVEDSAHNIWLPTADGIYVLRSNHPNQQPERLSPGCIIAAATTGQVTYFLFDDGSVYAYDTQMKQVLPKGADSVKIPSAMGRPSKVNIGFMWQGRWMLFTPEGTFAMNLQNGTFEKPAPWQVDDGLDQGACAGYRFVANSSGRLWLWPDSGSVKTLDLIPNARYSKNRGRKFYVTRSTDGELFIATYGNGLFVYNPQDEQLHHYGANDANPLIHSDYLQCAMTDHQGNVWVGSEAAGAYCLSAISSAKVQYVKPVAHRLSDWDNTISAIIPMGDGLIVGTRQGHIYQTDNNRQLAVIDQKHAAVTSRLTDSHGRTWTGTWGDGLYIDNQHYTVADTLHHIPADAITHITEDRQGRIWVATWKGGLLMMDGEGRYTQMLHEDYNGSRINDIEPMDDGTLWIASNNGVCRVKDKQTDLYNTENKRFPCNEIYTICSDGQRTLWTGTAGSGVVKCLLDSHGNITSTTTITTREGLANNNAASIVIDRQGYVWVGTEDGVSRINPQTNIVSSYRFANTPQGNTCYTNCATIDADGRLLIGTVDGLLMINPEELTTGAQSIASSITDLYVNGISIHQLGLLSEALSRTSRLTLAHDQNSLRLYFSDFEYDSYTRSAFQYYLEGVEGDWQSTTTENHTDYSELPPGNYTFHLRSMNAEGQWNDEVTLQIVIRQPWWNTWWAWVIYLAVIALVAWDVYRNWKEKFLLHQQMKLDRQLMDFRARLFTNITHEFRTPLAIIKGAVDKLDHRQAAVQTAQRGTKRLLRLVNQFMEFRKTTTGNLRLRVQNDNIVSFVKDIYQDFWAMAQQKDIQTTFTPFARDFLVPFDHNIVETIVYNLLSNAVKYTPERGTVTVRMMHDEASATLCITVDDSGPGISDEQQKALFQPFMNGLASQGGMGIGLYTAHQMAAIHKGALTYQRTDSGSRFTFTLPATDALYAADDYQEVSDADAASSATADATVLNDLIRELQPEALNDQQIVIIEDDLDMKQQIQHEVGVYFRTVAYTNGQSGYEGVKQQLPALVICDVMLPDMDGYDIVTRLKQDPATAQIPVIMLTSLADERHQIKAYRAGADDYMTKPCNWNLLLARMIQLIKWREATLSAPDIASVNPSDNPLSSLLSPLSSLL